MAGATDYGRIAWWALDMVRAAAEQPAYKKLFLRWVLGEYAYREWIGLQDALMHQGFDPFMSYDCEKARYHQDDVPEVWWEDREPTPLIKGLKRTS